MIAPTGLISRAAVAGLLFLSFQACLRGTTEIHSDGFTATNQPLPGSPGYGSAVAVSDLNWTASAGETGVTGTPNIQLIWDGEGGGGNPGGTSRGLDTYLNWDGRGSVVQLDGSGTVGTPNTYISFVPAPASAVKIISFDLDAWAGWPLGGSMTVEWSIRDAAKTGTILASGSWSRDSGGRDTVSPGFAGNPGQTLVLQLTRTAGNADYLALDNLIFDELSASPSISSFTAPVDIIGGGPFDLSWEIARMPAVTSLTLHDGTTTVNVLPLTNAGTGLGSYQVNPVGTTTYTLTLNGTLTRQILILGGRALTFTADAPMALPPSYQVTLSWEITPPNAALVTISDGITTHNVTADTDPSSGTGSRLFTVPSAVTTFTLAANSSTVTRTVQVLRPQPSSASFAVSSQTVSAGSPVTVTWSNAAGGPTDWIGIYRVGDTPGPVPSTQWNYLNGTRTSGGSVPSGSMDFSGLPSGDYFACLLLNDAYGIASGPVLFSVVDVPAEPVVLPVVNLERTGGQFTVVWQSQTGRVYDVYASPVLTGNPLQDWTLVADDLPAGAEATTSFSENLGASPPGRRFYRVYEYTAP